MWSYITKLALRLHFEFGLQNANHIIVNHQKNINKEVIRKHCMENFTHHSDKKTLSTIPFFGNKPPNRDK